MKSLVRFVQPPSPCEYLKEQTWQLEYEEFESLSREEYRERMHAGWRRFGHTLLRPQCPTCRACQPLRIKVDDFRPTRTQQKTFKRNRRVLILRIGAPDLSSQVFSLYRRYHEFQHQQKLWTSHGEADPFAFLATYVIQPFETEAWSYFLGNDLFGVGYVDTLSDGLSAIYYFYDPSSRNLSLGTYNILSIIESARERGLPYVYLGYYVPGSPSMTYKANFRPYELLEDGKWKAVE